MKFQTGERVRVNITRNMRSKGFLGAREYIVGVVMGYNDEGWVCIRASRSYFRGESIIWPDNSVYRFPEIYVKRAE